MATSSETSPMVEMIHLPLVWVDANIKSSSNEEARKQFNENFGRCRFFASVEECKSFIEHTPGGAKVVLIVSGQLGSELVELIHENSNVSSIYVYCQWKEKHEAWARDYNKVKGVVTDLNELISKIRANHKSP